MMQSKVDGVSDVIWGKKLYSMCVIFIYAATSAYSLFHGLFVHRALVLACLYPLCGKMKAVAALTFASLAANTLLEISRMRGSSIFYAVIYYMGNLRYPEKQSGECISSSNFLYDLASKIAGTCDSSCMSVESSDTTQEIMDVFWLC